MLTYATVLVERDEGRAWVTLNGPEKRNAMSPTLNREMLEVLEQLEVDDGVGVVVLTGAGESFTAGMDLKEYFRETDNASAATKLRIRRASGNGASCASIPSRRSRWSMAGASAARSPR